MRAQEFTVLDEVTFQGILVAKPLPARERFELDNDAINNPFVEFAPCRCSECEAYRIALTFKGA